MSLDAEDEALEALVRDNRSLQMRAEAAKRAVKELQIALTKALTERDAAHDRSLHHAKVGELGKKQVARLEALVEELKAEVLHKDEQIVEVCRIAEEAGQSVKEQCDRNIRRLHSLDENNRALREANTALAAHLHFQYGKRGRMEARGESLERSLMEMHELEQDRVGRTRAVAVLEKRLHSLESEYSSVCEFYGEAKEAVNKVSCMHDELFMQLERKKAEMELFKQDMTGRLMEAQAVNTDLERKLEREKTQLADELRRKAGQAKKAEDDAQVKQEEVLELRRKVAQTRKAEGDAKAKLEDMQKELLKERQAMADLSELLDCLFGQLSTKDAVVRSMNQSSTTKMRYIVQRVNETRAESKKLREEAKKLRADSEQASKLRADGDAALRAEGMKVATLEEKLRDLKKAVVEKDRDLDVTKGAILREQQLQAALEREMEECRRLVDIVHAERESHARELAMAKTTLETERHTAQREAAVLRIQYDNERAEREKLETAMRKTKEEHQREKLSLHEEVLFTKHEISEIKSQLEKLNNSRSEISFSLDASHIDRRPNGSATPSNIPDSRVSSTSHVSEIPVTPTRHSDRPLNYSLLGSRRYVKKSPEAGSSNSASKS